MDLKERKKMNSEELANKTKQFAIKIIKVIDTLPRTMSASIIAKQVIRSATSIGANYREACSARSKAEFASKIGLCEQEANEIMYWLELLQDLKLLTDETIKDIKTEANEILSIFIASGKTVNKYRKEQER